MTERLISWKDIAAYVGRDVRTVIRWEKTRGFPVHRIPGGQRQGVFAYPAEIDRWWTGAVREEASEVEPEPAVPPPGAPNGIMVASPGSWNKVRTHAAVGLGGLLLLATLAAAVRRSLAPATLEFSRVAQITNDGLEKRGLLTSGSHLYFGEEHNGLMALASTAADGGTVRTLWNPSFNILPEDLSPDNRYVLALGYQGIENEKNIWIVPVDGEKPRKLEGLTAHSASWSPDDRTIAYANGQRILLASTQGTDIRVIGAFDGVPDELRWSPDARWLRFLLLNPVTLKSTYWQLRLVEGTKPTAVSQIALPIQNCCDHWSHSLGPEYLVSGTVPQPALWLLTLGGDHGNPRAQFEKVGLDVSSQLSELAYDPSRDRLLVMEAIPSRGRFVQYDPRSLEFQQALPGISGMFLDYSPDGKWIAYTRPEDNTLWISRDDGTAAVQLTHSPEMVELPRWSPDGKSIAYMSKKDGNLWRIFVRSIQGGTVREASEGDDAQGAPTWSPDGRFLVYGELYCESTHNCSINRIDLATGKVQMVPGSEGLETARWSPDGRYIAALNPEAHELLLFDVSAQRWRVLTDNIDGNDVGWSRDSKFLYASCLGNAARIVRVPVATGDVETVVDFRQLDPVNRAEVADTWFTITPNGSLLLRDWPHSAEIYSYTLKRH